MPTAAGIGSRRHALRIHHDSSTRLRASGRVCLARPGPRSWGRIQRCKPLCSAGSSAGNAPQPAASKRLAVSQLLHQSWQLIKADAKLLKRHIWAVLVVYAVKDLLAFVLHRFSHKLTNTVAQQVLGIPAAAVGNTWWISLDPAFLETFPGYQVLMGVFFLLTLPFNLLLDAGAIGAAATIAATSSSSRRSPSRPGSANAQIAAHPNGAITLVPAEVVDGPDGSSSSSSGSSAAALPVLGVQIHTNSGALVGLPPTYISQQAISAPGKPLQLSFQQRAGGVGEAGWAIGAVEATLPQLAGNSTASSSSSSSSSQAAVRSGSPVLKEKRRPWDRPASPALPTLDVVASLKQGGGAAKRAWDSCKGRLGALWRTDVLLTSWSLPLQGLSLMVLPAVWTLPRLMGIQLTMAAAVLSPGGDVAGKSAMDRSQALMTGYKVAYALPYVGLIAGLRGVEALKQLVLAAVPLRWWQEVVEVPVLITAAFSLLALLVTRLQDLLPVAAYLIRSRASSRAGNR